MTAGPYNPPKPGLRHTVEYDRGVGFFVRNPEGRMVTVATPFKLLAEQQRAALQIEADRRAKRGPRACLSCDQPFQSEGIHNRLCNTCRRSSDELQPVRPYIARSA